MAFEAIQHIYQPPTSVTEKLRRAIERKQLTSLWGVKQFVTPRLIDEVFGDGLQLIWISPTNHRPNWYVVRIDSRWHLSNWDEGELFIDYLDEVYLAAEEQFGCAEEQQCLKHLDNKEDCFECSHRACERERYFPRCDWSLGSGWGREKWPAGCEPTRRRVAAIRAAEKLEGDHA